MLKGTIQEHDEQAAAWGLLMWVLRFMAVVGVLGFLSIYIFTEKVYVAFMSSVYLFFGGASGTRVPKAPQMNSLKKKSFHQFGNWFQRITGTKKSSEKSM